MYGENILIAVLVIICIMYSVERITYVARPTFIEKDSKKVLDVNQMLEAYNKMVEDNNELMRKNRFK